MEGPEPRAGAGLHRPTLRGSTSWAKRGMARLDEIGILGAFLAICAILTVTTDDKFLRTANILSVSRQASYYGIMAVGMVFVISMGDVDLSVGSILTLVNVGMAIALAAGQPLLLAMLLGLIIGAICGFTNGALSVVLRIPTIIVTLGTLSLFRGLALVLADGKPVSDYSKDNWFFQIGGGTILGVPTSVWGMIVVGILGFLLYNYTVFGQRVQAIGSNLQAARFSGISISRYRLLVMTLMGVIAALAAIFALAFLGAGDPQTGPGLELSVIAATIIGGTALTGGVGSIFGAIIGALIIAVIRNGLILLGVSAYWSIAATGLVIIAAVAIDYLIKRR
jgi:ribose transport system permease protein